MKIRYLPIRGVVSEVGGMISIWPKGRGNIKKDGKAKKLEKKITNRRKNTVSETRILMHKLIWKMRRKVGEWVVIGQNRKAGTDGTLSNITGNGKAGISQSVSVLSYPNERWGRWIKGEWLIMSDWWLCCAIGWEGKRQKMSEWQCQRKGSSDWQCRTTVKQHNAKC